MATLHLSFTQTDHCIKDRAVFTVYLWTSALAVFAVGVTSLTGL